MTEQEFRQALKRSLSGADLPDCRKRQVLAQMRGEAIMKKRTRLHIVFAILAVLLLTTATAAVASGMFKGTVDWNGQPQIEDVISTSTTQESVLHQPNVTPKVVTPPVNSVERIIEVQTILNEEAAAANGDLVLLTEKDDNPYDTLTSRRSTVQRTIAVADYDALQALVGASSLPLPASLPEGYSITSLHVYLDCRIEGAYTPISTAEHTLHTDGSAVTVTRYHANEEHDIITGYNIQTTNSAGDTLSIRAELTADSSSTGVGLWDDETAQAVEVPGMQNALIITGSQRNQLYLRAPLANPVAVINPLHADEAGDAPSKVLTDLYISISGTAIAADDLLTIFGK